MLRTGVNSSSILLVKGFEKSFRLYFEFTQNSNSTYTL